MLDALAFALFGKPHRNINKPQLVTHINNKDCSVEVSFDVTDHNINLFVAIKPNVLRYGKWQMINQSSHAKEYQKILEQNILKAQS